MNHTYQIVDRQPERPTSPNCEACGGPLIEITTARLNFQYQCTVCNRQVFGPPKGAA